MSARVENGYLYITNKKGLTAEIGKALGDAARDGRIYKIRWYINGERDWSRGYKGYRTLNGAKRAAMSQLNKQHI